MHQFLIGRAGEAGITRDMLERTYRLRHAVFQQRLRWDVQSIDGLEYDRFDDSDTVYVIGRNLRSGAVDASWRLRPTTAPYMLRDVFPELLHGRQPPHHATVWEVSRFAVSTGDDSDAFGFRALTQDLVAHTLDHGARHGIDRFVWVCGVGVERLALNLGYRPKRLGPPIRIGRVLSVAAEIAVDAAATSVASIRLGAADLRAAA